MIARIITFLTLEIKPPAGRDDVLDDLLSDFPAYIGDPTS